MSNDIINPFCNIYHRDQGLSIEGNKIMSPVNKILPKITCVANHSLLRLIGNEIWKKKREKKVHNIVCQVIILYLEIYRLMKESDSAALERSWIDILVMYCRDLIAWTAEMKCVSTIIR